MSLLSFAASQRARLDALRDATEKEKAILKNAHSHSVNEGMPLSSTESAASKVPMVGVPFISSSLSSPSRDLETVLLEEAEILRKESLLDQRVAVAEERKRELLASFASLTYREKELREQELQLDRCEEQLRRQEEENRARQRELSQQIEHFQLDLAERSAKAASARRKLDERRAENTRTIERMRQQVHEQEDRVRTVEAQIITRQRKLEDDEREVARRELKLRDAELSAIYELRLDIDRRRNQLM